MRPLKIAIVGTGNVAANNYLPFLSRQEHVSLSYLSRTKSKAEACQQKFGGKVCDSPAELMADQPDTVLILTNEDQRYDVACQLLEFKPKRLFMEKPLHARLGQAQVTENDFFEARELMRKAEQQGVETAMMFNYRFFEVSAKLREVLAGRDTGPLRQATLYVNYACWSHCLDLLQHFGGDVTTVQALNGTVSYGSGRQQGPDLAAAFLMANGATGTVLGTSGSAFKLSLYHLILNFEHAMIVIDDLDSRLEVNFDNTNYRESYSLLPNFSRWNQYSSSFEKALAAYLQSLEQNVPPPVPGRAGLAELQLEAALRRSARLQAAVNVQQDFPMP
ncbi:MAG: Gfo/Idh/MocA family oxidoreductase [Lentisphaerae bacterium]|nr:Gfo/Idh/MocA family oxidoreductase [Lentisphaerota bacterium]